MLCWRRSSENLMWFCHWGVGVFGFCLARVVRSMFLDISVICGETNCRYVKLKERTLWKLEARQYGINREALPNGGGASSDDASSGNGNPGGGEITGDEGSGDGDIVEEGDGGGSDTTHSRGVVQTYSFFLLCLSLLSFSFHLLFWFGYMIGIYLHCTVN